ncbi:sensor histidine kinase [Sphingomonas immobilis]|uniref:histidine kinase n=1 Tax=Sphingomonas immobilis TaxID=3063997 RepID=A0ABT8ZVW8_9SPHN|nr:sensor histidine kinase [Sphingomonas sp. CA1-15]MDO7841428.1 CHASE3 domain-containing protein [Sphingomonas sp. CA1-15]
MFETVLRRFGGTRHAIGRFLIVCMVVGFLALLAAGVAAVLTVVRTERHTEMVNHTYVVKLAIDRARTLVEQGETARRGYLLTGDKAYRDNYVIAARVTPREIDRINDLTADNPNQVRNIGNLRMLVSDLIEQRERTIADTDAGRRDAAIATFTAEKNARRMFRIREILSRMSAEESRLLTIRNGEQRAGINAFYVTLSVAALLLLVVATFSLATVLQYTRDLNASQERLRDFADSLEEQVAERTAELTRANEEVQRFAYIVSHDLRSPLVNVMGFTAELESATATIRDLIDRVDAAAPGVATEDDRLAAREDLPEAIGFIRTSTQKMDRLINAILKLSREGRRTIMPDRLDIAAMGRTIRASVQHLLDERGAEMIVEDPVPAIVNDRLAVEQILSNVIENAIKYLSPDRPGRIVLRGHVEGSRAIFDIEDNGRGIAPSDHTRIFDLFRRSGQQDQPGEGIGLAHVRALAYRLGGTIDVESELGTGSTFRITLPLTYVDPQSGQPANKENEKP